MKLMKCVFSWMLALAFCLSAWNAALSSEENQPLPFTIEVQEAFGPANEATGESDSYVRYPLLHCSDAALVPAAEKINRTIEEKAHLSAYLHLLSTVTPGSAGLRMGYSLSAAVRASDNMPCLEGRYLSILFSAEGKMLSGRPSQVYYPMTFDLLTGDEVTFDQLFADPEGARRLIEEYLETEVEPTLSTHLENNQLLPVPFDRFFLDPFGRILFLYENSQLSFLSGVSGSVSFRYSQLSSVLDFSPNGVIAHLPWQMYVMNAQQTDAQRAEALWKWLEDDACLIPAARPISLSEDVSTVLSAFHSTADSSYYPGGAYYEVEEPAFRGALILTDESEEKVTGLQTSQLDLFGISTNTTTLDEAAAFLSREAFARMELNEAAAELYRVCPGEMLIYSLKRSRDQQPMTLTLYADQDGVIQFIKLAIQ